MKIFEVAVVHPCPPSVSKNFIVVHSSPPATIDKQNKKTAQIIIIKTRTKSH